METQNALTELFVKHSLLIGSILMNRSRTESWTRTTHTTHWKKRRLIGASKLKLLRAALLSSTILAEAAQKPVVSTNVVLGQKGFYWMWLSKVIETIISGYFLMNF